MQKHCKSSEVLLEWEARLGSEFPFRRADEALTFFSHGAVSVEDTTIARHMLKVGTRIERDWLYRSVPELRDILTHRATRDTETGEPIIYMSCDAHALRRYVDETWDAQWKMANGLRLWCIDRTSGATIHIGGEYTWGDCRQVGLIFASLKASGHLPDNSDYGADLKGKLVFVSDGMPWFEEHILPLFPWAIAVLDAYHVMERLAAYGNERYGRGSNRSRHFYDESLTALLGQRPATHRKAIKRKGSRRQARPEAQPATTTAAGGKALLASLKQEVLANVVDAERHANLVAYLEHNVLRIDYPRFRRLGYQIGSGAMESIHRTASQCRLKIPGGRWLAETSQAIFNLRMMLLAGRWNDFWNRADLSLELTHAFSPVTKTTAAQA